MTANYLEKTLEVPSWIRRKSMNERLNYIVRMYSETCGDNWYLWIETAVEALPILIISLLAVSKVDVIKEVLEQKYGCGLRQAIGKGSKVPKTFRQKALSAFWKIERVRGELVWWWLIAEATTAYVMEWQSIVVQEQRCNHPPHAGPCILDLPGSTLQSILGHETFFYKNREYDPSGWSGTAGNPTIIGPDEIGTYNVGSSCTCVWGLPGNITWRCWIGDGFGNIVAVGPAVTHPSNVPTTNSCFGVATALSIGQASFRSGIEILQSPGGTFGSCSEGTFSVGLQQQ